MVSKPNPTEQSCQDQKPTNLNRLSSKEINGEHTDPEPRDITSTDQNQVTSCGVTVVGHVQHEPRHSGTQKNLQVSPLGKMGAEVLQAGLWRPNQLDSLRHMELVNLVWRGITMFTRGELL
ncbi:hypothetical protein WICPIJ_002849 [Wickerhamomyces pijperi]|uniref:Uncharacterized protein n=1 Tax=Wickerhamomyces pijperi TaxID=599730 RepID=A0A9P8TPT0_WICPI|nr:hypothetical protein WICPIJ_002849 [Wickerhamomyces pijperi]